MRKKILIALTAFIILASPALASVACGRNMVQEIYDLQTILHWPNSEGAIDRNKTQYISAGLQKYAVDIIRGAIRRNDSCLLANGVNVIDYGFDHMNVDGSFESFDPDTEEEFPLVDQLSASAFFLQTVMLSYLSTDLTAYDSDIVTAFGWLVPQYATLYAYDEDTMNRLAIDGQAFLFYGRAAGNATVEALGITFLDVVIASQTAAGVFPEEGGFDSSYQAVTLMMLLYVYIHVPPGDQPDGLYDAIVNGMRWELTRIESDGKVRNDGNTRTNGQEEVLGEAKTVNYPQVITALALYAEVFGDRSVRAVAEKVYDYTLRLAGLTAADVRTNLVVAMESCE